MAHSCPICYASVRHPQQVTCGGRDCRDAWKHLNSAARLKRENLASMSPSERAYCLSQGPSPDEIEAQSAQHEQLDSELAEYQHQQEKKRDSGFLPKSLREMLINNAPISTPKKEDPDEKNELSGPTSEAES